MNHYTYSDLSIGLKEEFLVDIVPNMLEKFYEITGDCNPLHRDEAFAENQGYTSCVSYGMLTASFLSTLAGVYLPGEKSLIQSVETKFLSPVFSGNTLRICGEVVELNDTVQQMVMKVTIFNEDNKKILRGKMKIGFLK